jgi:hypothetical protein
MSSARWCPGGSAGDETVSPPDDSDRDVILARRRLFVASAMASIAVTQTQCESPFRPCLEPAIRADAGTMVCLAPPRRDLDASVSSTDASLSSTDASGDAPGDAPQPCLGPKLPAAERDAATKPPRPEPPPRVCLSQPPPMPCLKPVMKPE